jgi:hypothetical protein
LSLVISFNIDKDEIAGKTGAADIGHIATAAVEYVAGSTLPNAAGEETGLVAGLAEAVGGAGGAVDQIADEAGRAHVGVDCVITAILAVVEGIAEGAVGDVAQLADPVAEGVAGQAASTGGD